MRRRKKKTPGEERRQKPDKFEKKTLSLACLDSDVASVANRFPRTPETLPNWRVLASRPPALPLGFNPEINFLVQIAAPATLENSRCAGTCPDTSLCESGSSPFEPFQWQTKQVGTPRGTCLAAAQTTTGRGESRAESQIECGRAPHPHPPSRDCVRGKQNKGGGKGDVYF